MYAAALSSGLFLGACSGQDAASPPASPSDSPSLVVGIDPAISSASIVDGPGAAMGAALQSLKDKKISGFLKTIVPSSELNEMRASWKKQKAEEVSAEEEAEFQAMIGMFTGEGAEDMLFSMAQPKLKDVQEQLNGLSMMLPMMASGALQEAGAPAEANAMVGQFSAKIAKLDVTDEKKLRKAIGVLVTSARSLKIKSIKDVQALSFDEILERGDVLYGGLIDILDVYGLSPQETLKSMQCKVISTEGDLAKLEMTFSLFGSEPQTVPFEMERLEGQWVPKKPEPTQEVEPGRAHMAR